MAWSIPSTLIVAGNGLSKSVVLPPRVTRRPCTLPLQMINMAQGGIMAATVLLQVSVQHTCASFLQFDSR